MKRIACSLFVCVVVLVGARPSLADAPYSGGGGFDFGASFVPAIGPNGEPGRLIVLTGTIQGDNFEPGICTPAAFLGGKCIFFTNSLPVAEGYFKRAHPGQTAFTFCDPCTIDGRTGSFVLKISYPDPTNINSVPPTGFTKFTIQNADGGLIGLRGQGTLDLSAGTYTLQYQFQP